MQTAIFGIHNDGLNLVVSLIVFMLVTIWIALIVWTYLDARRRIDDQVLVLCATAASIFPFIGTFVYTILRPPDFIEDARERELEIKAAELRVRQLSELSCPNCGYPVEKSYLRCPNCQRRLKDPCQTCGKPVDPRWALCPYCESALPGRERKRSRSGPPKPPRQRQPEKGEAEKQQASSRQAAGSKQSSAGSRERSARPAARRQQSSSASAPKPDGAEQATEERRSERSQ